MVNRYQFRLNILDVLSDEAARLLIPVTDLNLVQNTFDPIQLVERSFNLANIAFATTVRADINVIKAAITATNPSTIILEVCVRIRAVCGT